MNSIEQTKRIIFLEEFEKRLDHPKLEKLTLEFNHNTFEYNYKTGETRIFMKDDKREELSKTLRNMERAHGELYTRDFCKQNNYFR